MEENSQILENAHSEFKRQNYEQAEELYTKFIASCLQSRYRLSLLYKQNVLTVSHCSPTSVIQFSVTRQILWPGFL